MGRRAALLAAIACLAIPSRATTQINFASALTNVTDIGVGVMCWHGMDEPSLRRTNCSTHNVFVELVYKLENSTLPLQAVRDSVWFKYDTVRVDKVVGGDSTLVINRTRRTTLVPALDSVWRMVPEVALGYSQFGTFESRLPGIEVTGAVRELPYFVARASFAAPADALLPGDNFQMFVGARTGIVQLHNFRARTPKLNLVPADTLMGMPSADSVRVDSGSDQAWAGAGQTFALGVEVGLRILVRALEVNFLVARQERSFPGIEWSGQSDKLVPDAFPRRLDLGGWNLSFGARFHIGNGDDDG